MSAQILLIQARNPGDPMLEHEWRCFATQAHLPLASFTRLNATTDPLNIEGVEATLEAVDAVMIGGSGDFSVVQGGFAWHEPMLELVEGIITRRTPVFASCFGHQIIAQIFGGAVETLPEKAELGTFEISLTEDGRRDPIIGALPPRFNAQLGHNDSVTAAPAGCAVLASSSRCPVQAMRVVGFEVITTQFHPELDHETNFDRYMRYINAYKPPHLSVEEAMKAEGLIFEPSPEASTLLKRFVESLRPR